MTIIDPCETASIVWLSPTDGQVYNVLQYGSASYSFSATDTVSQSLNKPGFCGAYDFSISLGNSFPLTLGSSLGTFEAYFADPSLIGTQPG